MITWEHGWTNWVSHESTISPSCYCQRIKGKGMKGGQNLTCYNNNHALAITIITFCGVFFLYSLYSMKQNHKLSRNQPCINKINTNIQRSQHMKDLILSLYLYLKQLSLKDEMWYVISKWCIFSWNSGSIRLRKYTFRRPS